MSHLRYHKERTPYGRKWEFRSGEGRRDIDSINRRDPGELSLLAAICEQARRDYETAYMHKIGRCPRGAQRVVAMNESGHWRGVEKALADGGVVDKIMQYLGIKSGIAALRRQAVRNAEQHLAWQDEIRQRRAVRQERICVA